MIFKTIIEEETLNHNKRIYKSGCLEKIKSILDERIKNKTAFVGFGEFVQSDLDLKDAYGYVTSFDIVDGQGVLNIEFLETDKKLALISLASYLNIDFNVLMDAVQRDDNFNQIIYPNNIKDICGIRFMNVNQLHPDSAMVVGV